MWKRDPKKANKKRLRSTENNWEVFWGLPDETSIQFSNSQTRNNSFKQKFILSLLTQILGSPTSLCHTRAPTNSWPLSRVHGLQSVWFFLSLWKQGIISFLHSEKGDFAPHWWRYMTVFEARSCFALTWSWGCWSSVCVCALAADDSCKLTCENGGKCIINEKGDPRCHCWPSYSGERCETNHCHNYCQNGGTCGASLLGKYFWTALSCCYYLH